MFAGAAAPYKEARAFRYGFVSSRTSGALQEFLDTRGVSHESRQALRNASALLKDIIEGQSLYGGEKKKSVAPTQAAMDAFGCAMEVILAHSRDFGVSRVRDMANLFGILHRTLQDLLSASETHGLRPNDVQKTRLFFKKLAELMLAQVTAPRKEQLPIR